MSPEFLDKLNASGEMFVHLFLELAILFLLISFFVAIINQRLPAEKIQAILGGKNGRGYLAAAGLGAITPFCSCSTIPMLIGLLKARAGFGPTMTFLFTSPLLNPIVIALFIPVLGLSITLFYAALALGASITAGVILQRAGFDRFIKQDLLQATEQTASCCASQTESTQCTPPEQPSTLTGARNLSAAAACCEAPEPTKKPSIDWRMAWQESYSLFKQMLPYMLIAMTIGAGIHGFLPAEFFAEVASADNPAAVPAAAVIGIPLYMRVTTIMPLVGSFMAKGVSIGAIMALVIGSGGASLPEMILLKRLFHWQLLLAFLAVIFTVAVSGGYAFNAIWG